MYNLCLVLFIATDNEQVITFQMLPLPCKGLEEHLLIHQ